VEAGLGHLLVAGLAGWACGGEGVESEVAGAALPIRRAARQDGADEADDRAPVVLPPMPVARCLGAKGPMSAVRVLGTVATCSTSAAEPAASAMISWVPWSTTLPGAHTESRLVRPVRSVATQPSALTSQPSAVSSSRDAKH
jgi:hypothetical protein